MDNKEIYGKQEKLSLYEFVLELPNSIAAAVVAITTGSLISWMDLVDSLKNVINSGFVTLTSKKLKRDLKYEYNYGIGKVEAIASLCCEVFLIFGLFFVCFFSVVELLEPKRPSDLLFVAVLLKVVHVGADIFFLIRQRKISQHASRIAQTEYKAIIQCLAFDAIALISQLICYVFRNVRAIWYFSPVLCLAMSVYFFVNSISRIRAAVRELTDRTLPEDQQLLILKALNECYDGYAELIAVNSHINGDRVIIDLHIAFGDNTSYGEIQTFLHKVSERIHTDIPDSAVQITISE